MRLRYRFTIRWSDADLAFVADVPDLPGCMAHGETRDAAIHNVENAIELWIVTATEFGDPVPEPKGQCPTRA